ncbi:MAG: UDP-3-O-acyl-N-acetylglucosamine deacetylase [Kiritimatiellae bacterium]|nr:UDP-3-O-acyl-N-acetylglucosamine deacetylase [Kiritimatiellia bacterium]MDW8457828.1 UDP-3-O-acyl-N-acetylglucosamine deacetylase [Verrucomicrobiota bacterium]
MNEPLGTILAGDRDTLLRAWERMQAQPIDRDLSNTAPPAPDERQRTLARSTSVSGPGTFLGKATSTLTFEPTDLEGWWFERADLDDCLPVRVSIRNVWTTGDIVSNIVLRSGPPQNYVRMVEHIIALKLGMRIDNVLIRCSSGDPPLFKLGSLPLVEALDAAGFVETARPVAYWTVKERVTVGLPNGSFLLFSPDDGSRTLWVDCAIDFPNAIGRQRIKFPLTDEGFRFGAAARTNAPFSKMIWAKTIGQIFADVRNLGYNMENVLVAGKRRYINEPRLMHDGKSLEAVWHRAALDLLAALSLLEEGRFVGRVESYRAGHFLDCYAMRLLYKRGLLCRAAAR